MAEEQIPRGQVVRGKNGKSGLIVAVIFLPILFAIGSGAAVYFYLKSNMQIAGITEELDVGALEEQMYHSGEVISTLENRISELETELGEEGEVPDPMSFPTGSSYGSLDSLEKDLPAISWDRAGLLTQSERNALQAHLIDPYFDYHNADGMEYIAMVISVPTEEGAPYEVRTIHRNGGGEGFFYGQRGGVISWWYPDCLGECDFPPDFSEKYPELISVANGL